MGFVSWKNVAGKVDQTLREQFFFSSGLDVTRPLTIRASVTDRCNYRCLYCNHWGRDEYEEELTPDQWAKFFQDLIHFNPFSNVQFVGGEPFLRSDFLEIASHAFRVGLPWGVITNGFALGRADLAEKIIDLAPLNIDISLDGATPRSHDISRNMPGSFKKVSDGIRAIAEAKLNSKSQFPIRIKTVVHRHNITDLPTMVGNIQDMGASTIDFTPIRPMANSRYEELNITDEESQARLVQSIDTLVKMKNDGAPIETSIDKLKSMTGHFQQKKIIHGKHKCHAGIRDALVSPSGEIKSCWHLSEYGSIREASIQSIWASTEAMKIRHESLTCEQFGNAKCATSCLSHRTFFQDIGKAALYWKELRNSHRLTK